MTPVLVNWYVVRAQGEARQTYGGVAPATWLDRCAEEAVLDVIGSGVRVTDYVAELALRRMREAVERWERAVAPDLGDRAAS